MIIHGDCIEAMRDMDENSIDAIVADGPYAISFMQKAFDTFESPAAYYDFTVKWASEALRVLKPGGSLLCFGGTRTWHRLGVGLEDAGFRIKDTLMWLYGSGFPKAQDLGKMIDKRRNDDISPVVQYLRDALKSSGLTNKDIDNHFGFKGKMAGHWMSKKSQPAIPNCEQWLQLKDLLHFDDSMDAEVWRLNGRKGKPGENYYEREVIGSKTWTQGGGNSLQLRVGEAVEVEQDITLPATSLAQHWDGYKIGGIKPAWESIVWAQKPWSDCDIIRVLVRNLLINLEVIQCLVNEASTTDLDCIEKIIPHGKAGDSSEVTVMLSDKSMASSILNIVSLWQRCLVGLSKETNTSTISTDSEMITDLRTCDSLLSAATQVCTTQDGISQNGGALSVANAVHTLAVVFTKHRDTLTSFATENVTEAQLGEALSTSVETPLRPNWLPIIWAVKPPEGTYIDNVLKYGVGAVNVAETRIGVDQWDDVVHLCGSCALLVEKNTKPSTRVTRECTVPANVDTRDSAKGETTRRDMNRLDIGCSDGMKVANSNTSLNTVESGKTTSESSPMDLKSTTPTKTKKITDLRTCALCGQEIIEDSTCATTRSIPRNLLKQIISDGGEASQKFENATLNICGSGGPTGRFPSNLLLSHSPECRQVGVKRVKGNPLYIKPTCGFHDSLGRERKERDDPDAGHADPDGYETCEEWSCVDDCPVKMLDEQSGELKSGKLKSGHKRGDSEIVPYGGGGVVTGNYGGDTGGASRFFYCSKASKREPYNDHPTLKPVKLMEHLVRLVTRPGQVVLDCFAGSGTTGVACINSGREFILVEQDKNYISIAEKRIAETQAGLF